MNALYSIADAKLNKLVSTTTRLSGSHQTEVCRSQSIYTRYQIECLIPIIRTNCTQLREYVNMVNKQAFYLFSSPDKSVILTQELTAEMLLFKLSATCSGS